jgi:hypothetical protein
MILIEPILLLLPYLLRWRFRQTPLPEHGGKPKMEVMGNYTIPSPDSMKLSVLPGAVPYGRNKTSDHHHYSSVLHLMNNKALQSPPLPFKPIGQGISKITVYGHAGPLRLLVMRAELKAVELLCRRTPMAPGFLSNFFNSAENLNHPNRR